MVNIKILAIGLVIIAFLAAGGHQFVTPALDQLRTLPKRFMSDLNKSREDNVKTKMESDDIG